MAKRLVFAILKKAGYTVTVDYEVASEFGEVWTWVKAHRTDRLDEDRWLYGTTCYNFTWIGDRLAFATYSHYDDIVKESDYISLADYKDADIVSQVMDWLVAL